MERIFESPEQVTPGVLTEILQEGGWLVRGEVVEVRVRKEEGEQERRVGYLEFEYSEGSEGVLPRFVVLKMGRWEEGKGKDGKMSDERREVDFYRMRSGERDDLPVLRCYGAGYMEGGYWLLVEDVAATHASYNRGELSPRFEHCRLVVEGLARVHARWWGKVGAREELRGEYKTKEWIEETVRVDRERCVRFQEFLGDRLGSSRHGVLERVCEVLPELMGERLLRDGPVTVVHGQMSFERVLYPRSEGVGERAYLVDWGQWRVDMGGCDLAELLGVHWYPARRVRMEERLVRVYYEQLRACGVEGYAWEECWQDYRLGVVRALLLPARLWASERWAWVWWHDLERIFPAFEDLKCEKLLDDYS